MRIPDRVHRPTARQCSYCGQVQILEVSVPYPGYNAGIGSCEFCRLGCLVPIPTIGPDSLHMMEGVLLILTKESNTPNVREEEPPFPLTRKGTAVSCQSQQAADSHSRSPNTKGTGYSPTAFNPHREDIRVTKCLFRRCCIRAAQSLIHGEPRVAQPGQRVIRFHVLQELNPCPRVSPTVRWSAVLTRPPLGRNGLAR
jgi:hypothetical protein